MKKEFIIQLLEVWSIIMKEHKEYLIELDSVVGDGDLGLTMSDGFLAAYETVKETVETDIGKLLYGAGKAMSIAVPSTMGTLMASGFMQAGKVLKGKDELAISDMIQLFAAYEEGVAARGKAKIGEKTFLDGIHPAIEEMQKAQEQGMSLKDIGKKATEGAQRGFDNTTTMVAVHGRAATRGEASKALKDPGAAVAVLLMQGFEAIII